MRSSVRRLFPACSAALSSQNNGADVVKLRLALTRSARHRVSTSRIGLVPLQPDGERLVAYLERRTPWDS